MYLKLIRHKRLWGQLQRGTLYAVHFQPNEKGGYNAQSKYTSLFAYTVAQKYVKPSFD